MLGIDTGFRRGELLGLQWSDYSGGRLHLHAGETKSGHARSVPVSARCRALLDARKESGSREVLPGLTDAVLRGQWETLRLHMGRVADPMFIVHVLRHTCATRLVSAGVHLHDVKQWMGHSTIEMTLKYAHFAKGHLNDALAKLEEASA